MIYKSIVLVSGFAAVAYITSLISLYIIDGHGACYDDKPGCALVISWIGLACIGMAMSIFYGIRVCGFIKQHQPVEVLTPRVQTREDTYAYV
jgi:deoxyinosine 3'endonuclease (endonuclease V)